MLGRDNYENKNLSGQIAFRFPELRTGSGTVYDKDNIQSFPWHTDGLRQGKAHSFSLLLGVCLSDVDEDFSGNLLVWPGSHLLLHQCKTGANGALDCGKLASLVQRRDSPFSDLRPLLGSQASSSSSSNHHTSHTVGDLPHDNEPELPRLGKPVHFRGKKGVSWLRCPTD